MFRHSLHITLLFTALFLTWHVFSGINTLQFHIYGAISCGIAALFTLRMQLIDKQNYPFHLALTAPFYWLWLLKEMVVSGLEVTRIIWDLEHKIQPGFLWLPITQHTDLGRTIFANSLTLTPGTCCVDIKPTRVFIHALEKDPAHESAAHEMGKRVSRLMKSPPSLIVNALQAEAERK